MIAVMPQAPRTQMRSFHLDAPRGRTRQRVSDPQSPGPHDHVDRDRLPAVRGSRELRAVGARVQHRFGRRHLHGIHAGRHDVSVAYTLTPLQPQAEAFVEEFLDPRQYERMIDEWQAATSAALARAAAG